MLLELYKKFAAPNSIFKTLLLLFAVFPFKVVFIRQGNAIIMLFFSFVDSLLYDYPSTDISDAESCFQIQCNQVFIGMVTMQYQALADMVSNFVNVLKSSKRTLSWCRARHSLIIIVFFLRCI